MRLREDLGDGERKIEAFLTDLAVRGKVAAATQNQAMNALVFLYRKVLEQPLDERIDAVRAERKVNVPVVLTREEVSRVIALLEGVPQLIVQLLYGSGLRILEAVRLRVKDVDFAMKQVTVRSGQGENQRAQLPAQLCDAPPATGHGHPHHPGTPGPFRCGYHDDLHARAPARRAGCAQPPG